VALFVTLAFGGALFQQRARTISPVAARSSVIPIYLALVLSEWGLVLFVVRGGLRRNNVTTRELIGGRWTSRRDVGVDVALGLGMWAFWKLIGTAWDRALGEGQAASIDSYLPQGILEGGLWIGVSLTAGFCEELVFRGYFQRQFQAWTRSPWIALVLQAALFGISHGYQGAAACTRIAMYGALFGLLAHWRKSLRPGMLAHAMTDILGGILRV
jgi:membrane protease YdiL (CAAX protease family)